jgi:primosomal protein N' (replication factor Y)
VPSSPARTDRILGVAVPVPGLGLLSYRAPDGAAPPKGARVTVPLGTRVVTGVVVDPDAAPPVDAGLRDVVEILDEAPFLPAVVVDLALWVGDYYASGPGDALAIAIPPAARRGDRESFRTVRVAELSRESGGDEAPLKGAKQREALGLLARAAGGLTLADLLKQGVSTATVRSLVTRGVVRLRETVVERDPFGITADGASHWHLTGAAGAEPALTDEQAAAFAALSAAFRPGAFRTMLLHGVTGSGKTQLYLRLARLALDAGRRVLVLVPEIALTPAVAGQFRARFGQRVAIQHSGLSDGERHDQWHRIRRGEVDVVVGTRSAVFAPLERLGLIVVDEEHDGAYKQEESPRYHGRDVAIVRAQKEGALVVLGSATPSLESAANAESGRYGLVRLTKRVLDRPLASVRVVDMRGEYAERGPDVTFSTTLLDAIDGRLARGEQSLVLLNRRGFATVIFCRQCGASLECPHCSVALTYYRAQRRVRCHYCNYTAAVPRRCDLCQGEFLEQSGFGTERLEADLRARFPGARLARVDRDTIGRRGAVARVLARVIAGEIDILVGTQMIAKGHDFPAVTLVGVVSADVGLGLADFRASERTFQLITQVVGRAGRGETAGEAVVQTLYPDHYAIRAAAAQDYRTFFDREMVFRRTMRYPPAVAMINVVVRARELETAMADAQDLVRRVREAGPPARVLGPAPAALARLRKEHRVQFLIKGGQRRAMRAALTRALDARPDLKRRTIVDVDPLTTL